MMRSTLIPVLIGILCALGLVIVQDGSAAIYKYIDNDGLINFADDLQTIPPQFRASAKIVSGEAKEEKKTEQQVKPQDQPAGGGTVIPAPSPDTAAAQGTHEKSPLSRRILVSLIVVVSALFAVVILGAFDIDNEKVVKIARLIILWGVSVFLIYAHTMDVVHFFGRMGKNTVDAQRERERKGQETARKVKEFNDFVDQLGNEGTAGKPTTDSVQSPDNR